MIVLMAGTKKGIFPLIYSQSHSAHCFPSETWWAFSLGTGGGGGVFDF